MDIKIRYRSPWCQGYLSISCTFYLTLINFQHPLLWAYESQEEYDDGPERLWLNSQTSEQTVLTENLCYILTQLKMSIPFWLNPLTPKITDFLTHFWPLLPKRKREYITTKPCIHNVFGSPLSIYEVRITLSCTGKPIWRI